jgi:hypothetical protein
VLLIAEKDMVKQIYAGGWRGIGYVSSCPRVSKNAYFVDVTSMNALVSALKDSKLEMTESIASPLRELKGI